jgi:hypothetical protein
MAVFAIMWTGPGNSNDRKEVMPFFAEQAVNTAWPNRLQVLER